MSNYLADGLQNGFSKGMDMMQAKQKLKKDAEMEQARQVFEQGLLDKRLSASKDEGMADRDAAAAHQQLVREDSLHRQILADADPRTVLARKQAQAQIDTFGQPVTPSPDQVLSGEVNRLKLQKERDALLAPPAATPVPTAKIRQTIGTDGKGGFAEYEIPQTDLEKTVGGMNAASYKSPFASQIADAQARIAKQQSEIAGGDTRTGFLGIGTSRQDLINQSQKQLLGLQAQDLAHQVQKGIITQDEADRRANALMGAH